MYMYMPCYDAQFGRPGRLKRFRSEVLSPTHVLLTWHLRDWSPVLQFKVLLRPFAASNHAPKPAPWSYL